MQLHTQLTVVTPPSVEPVTLTEAKLHCRVTISDDDTLITSLITVARKMVEARVKRSLINTTWNWSCDGFPWFSLLYPDRMPVRVDYEIRLPIAYASAVNSIQYYDWTITQQTLPTSQYLFTPGEPGRLIPYPYMIWPYPAIMPGAVTIQFVAGFGPDATYVPETYKAAIKLLVAHLYENREEVLTSIGLNAVAIPLPVGVDQILSAEEWAFSV